MTEVETGTTLEVDDEAWDGFVASTHPWPYLQLTAWGAVKAANGWSPRRAVVATPGQEAAATMGAQVLLRRVSGLPWAFAYAPRGPVASRWSRDAVEAWTARVRRVLAPVGAGVLRIDPEIEAEGPVGVEVATSLSAAGWRPAAAVQPTVTRLIDLGADEGALWSDLRKKWRQYVNRARGRGVGVVDATALEPGADPVALFYRIYQETARRAGFSIRSEASYRRVWEVFSARRAAHLLFAREADGEFSAVLFLVRCGGRVVEPYGGMTARAAESRANYLLKWEAIRWARAEGAAIYDLWGLATPGIAHFKAGFGGREVRYVGAFDLDLHPLAAPLYRSAVAIRRWIGRRGRRDAARPKTGEAGEGEP
jgi:peptidoglycan pentaglycine glycine transferase (the first glycine)